MHGISAGLLDVLASANQIYNKRFCILVRIMTDEGIVGIGESDYPGGPPSSVVSVLEKELGPSLIGKNPLDIQAIWDDMYYMHIQHSRVGIHMHAISGIDIALWDIAGKLLAFLLSFVGGITI